MASWSWNPAQWFFQSGVYPYQALNTTDNEIRLLKLDLSSTTGALRCSLEHHSLNIPPKYVALSYMWGERNDTRFINVGGTNIKVSANLDSALHQLCFHQKRYVWADALCINQCDIEERNNQVRRMRAIYVRAAEVAVFLGDADDDMAETMAVMRRLTLLSTQEQLTTEARLNPFEAVGRHRTSFRSALKTFLENPYWRRVWILQEVAVNRHVIIYCGRYVSEWNHMVHMLSASQRDNILCDLDYDCLSRLLSLREDFQKDINISLVRAIRDSQSSVATLPQDEVYGLLGITSDGDKFVSTPDYQQTLDTIYVNMTASWIQTQGSLDIICLQPLRRREPNILPSWCPDWPFLGKHPLDMRWERYISGQDFRVRAGKKQALWNATPGTRGNLSKSDLEIFDSYVDDIGIRLDVVTKVLKISAVFVGRVDGLSTVYGLEEPLVDQNRGWEAHSEFFKSITDGQKNTIIDIIYETLAIYEDPVLDRSTRAERLLSLWSEKTSDWLSERDMATLNWLKAIKEFSYCGRTLYEWALKMSSGRSPFSFGRKKAPGGKQSVHPQFLGRISQTLADGMRLMTTAEGAIGWVHAASRPKDQVFLLP